MNHIIFVLICLIPQAISMKCSVLPIDSFCHTFYNSTGFYSSSNLAQINQIIYRLKPLANSKCHVNIAKYICIFIFPKCELQYYKPCFDFCNDILSSCSNEIRIFANQDEYLSKCQLNPKDNCIDSQLKMLLPAAYNSSYNQSYPLCPSFMYNPISSSFLFIHQSIPVIPNCPIKCQTQLSTVILPTNNSAILFILSLTLSSISIALCLIFIIFSKCFHILINSSIDSSIISSIVCFFLINITLFIGAIDYYLIGYNCHNTNSNIVQSFLQINGLCLGQFLLVYPTLVFICFDFFTNQIIWFLLTYKQWSHDFLPSLQPGLNCIKIIPTLALTIIVLYFDSIELQSSLNICFLPYHKSSLYGLLIILPLAFTILGSLPLFIMGFIALIQLRFIVKKHFKINTCNLTKLLIKFSIYSVVNFLSFSFLIYGFIMQWFVLKSDLQSMWLFKLCNGTRDYGRSFCADDLLTRYNLIGPEEQNSIIGQYFSIEIIKLIGLVGFNLSFIGWLVIPDNSLSQSQPVVYTEENVLALEVLSDNNESFPTTKTTEQSIV